MSLLSSILAGAESQLEVDAVLSILEGAIGDAATEAGEATVERMITIPENVLQTICTKAGSNFNDVEALQRVAVAAYGDFLRAVVTPAPPVLMVATATVKSDVVAFGVQTGQLPSDAVIPGNPPTVPVLPTTPPSIEWVTDSSKPTGSGPN